MTLSYQPRTERMHVLIVHRNIEKLYPLVCILNEDKMQPKITASEHLDEALRSMSNESFHLILFDQKIDRRGTQHVLTALQEASPSTPLVMITPPSEQAAAEALLSRGLMDFILENEEFHPGILRRVLRNAFQQKQNEEHITHLIYYDHLTGLANRYLFRDRLQQAMLRAERNQYTLALLLVDIDHLHEINDSLGFEIGDALLSLCADRISNTLRRQDTTARLTGDEFGILLEHLTQPEDVGFVAQHLLQQFNMPFEVADQSIQIDLSIGIALASIDTGFDASALMKQADIAKYRAKDQGGKSFEYFSNTLNQAAIDQYNTCPDLQKALMNIFRNPAEDQSHLTRDKPDDQETPKAS